MVFRYINIVLLNSSTIFNRPAASFQMYEQKAHQLVVLQDRGDGEALSYSVCITSRQGYMSKPAHERVGKCRGDLLSNRKQFGVRKKTARNSCFSGKKNHMTKVGRMKRAEKGEDKKNEMESRMPVARLAPSHFNYPKILEITSPLVVDRYRGKQRILSDASEVEEIFTALETRQRISTLETSK